MTGEQISGTMVEAVEQLSGGRRMVLRSASLEDISLTQVDGVFTDPPYFDNVQYAELMDFCFVWLRLLLAEDVEEFVGSTTRSMSDLTGNATSGRDLAHFTEGLSRVFSYAAKSLRPGGPFVFTYHHNDVEA